MNRRKFIRNASCAAMGYTTLYSTLFNLKAISSAAIHSSTVMNDCEGYKALVCLMMSGGNDSFNMLVPGPNGQYATYQNIRESLALTYSDNPSNSQILSLNPMNGSDGELGVHFKLAGVKSLFDSGEVAFVSNVGSLVDYVDKNDYYNGTNVPLGLYSHSDQQQHWQTGLPQYRTGVGWGGKIADMIETANCNNTVSVNISLNGINTFQAGNDSFTYVISPYDGSIGISNYGDGGTFWNARDAAVNSIMDHNYQDAFKNAYKNEIKTSNDVHLLFSGAVDGITFNTSFADTQVSKSFEMIAKTIGARNALNMKRQIFFVDVGGFDNHENLLFSQELLFEEIDNALVSFNAAMKELGTNQDVTTFGVSEFGRTLTSNGQGSDHAWGGNVFAMGGAVNGNKIYSSSADLYPMLDLNNPLEVGGGVYIPTTAADSYFAELALWFGVPSSELVNIFPNIGNFYDPMSTNPPLGFLLS